MDKLKAITIAVCAVVGAVWGKMGILGPLLLCLFGCNVIDWITGSLASIAEGEGVSSARGRIGIKKKVGYWAEVGVCLLVDSLLIFVLPSMSVGGFTLNITAPVVAPMICVWLDLNEILSVIENLGRMGTPVPAWLAKFITALKDSVDKAGEEFGSKGNK